MKSPRDIHPKTLQKAVKEATTTAIQETFDLDLPITIQKDNKIVQVYKDGQEKFLKNLEKKPVTLKKRKFIIE